jgi:hypothetical protein
MSDEVEITNHRADATQNESLIGIARMGADAFGYTAKLRIDRGIAREDLSRSSEGRGAER